MHFKAYPNQRIGLEFSNFATDQGEKMQFEKADPLIITGQTYI